MEPSKCSPSIIIYIRFYLDSLREKQTRKLDDKLFRLLKEQQHPLFDINNTVICYNLTLKPSKYVFDTLSLGPRNAVLTKFDQNDIFAELEDLLKFC